MEPLNRATKHVKTPAASKKALETKKPERRPSHDWEALKLEWLASSESLHGFKVRKGIINDNWFYKKARDGRWMEIRREMDEKVAAKVMQAVGTKKLHDWERQVSIWKAIENQVVYILKHNVGADGKLIKPMDGHELRALAGTISESVKSQKLMLGEPTGEESGSGTTVNVHLNVVKLVQEIENDGAGPTPLDPPALDISRGG